MIIGITGLAASGKQVVADHLREEHGFAVLDFAKDAIIAEAEKRGISPTKMNLSLLGDELRETGGNAVFAKILLKKLEGDRTVITGFRSPEEVDCIRNESSNGFYLIEVFSDAAARFGRRRPADPQAETEFFARDERDVKNKGLGKVIEMADVRIENSGTVKELCSKVEGVVRGWLNE